MDKWANGAPTMVGGHAQQAEDLVRGEGIPASNEREWVENQRFDARWLARLAAEYARKSLGELDGDVANAPLAAAYAQSAKAAALASLALQKAYGALQ